MNLNLSYDAIADISRTKGYPFWEGKFDINIYGVRSNSLQVNEWNDVLGVVYKDDFGQKVNIQHRGTTKPGLYWLKNKMGNINGTFILIPDFYERCWKLGTHKDYKALVQANDGIFKGWRDNNADGRFDYTGKVYDDVTGLNCHAESLINDTDKVGAYSAGCQVREFDRDHFAFLGIVERSMSLYGTRVSYKLFEERDFM